MFLSIRLQYYQITCPYPNLTGRQHLQYYKTRFGLKTDITKNVGIGSLPEPSWDRKVKNYSLGMKPKTIDSNCAFG